jgi:uncharacterized phage-associated protein
LGKGPAYFLALLVAEGVFVAEDSCAMSARAVDVARTLLWLATQENQKVSNLRLQKLLYYVQCESLTRRGEPAFSEPIRAFDHGPVVKEVWDTFRCGDKSAINADEITPGVSGEDFLLVSTVWSDYRRYTDGQLYDMTHNERVYKDHYRPYPGFGISPEMPVDEIARCASSRQRPPISNEHARAVTRDFSPPESWFKEPAPF